MRAPARCHEALHCSRCLPRPLPPQAATIALIAAVLQQRTATFTAAIQDMYRTGGTIQVNQVISRSTAELHEEPAILPALLFYSASGKRRS